MWSAETSRRLFLQTLATAGIGIIIPGWMPHSGHAAVRLGDVPAGVVLNDLKGNSFAIPSDFRGRVALLHFWASWCPTCRGEMTALETLYARYASKGVVPCSIGLGEKKETALTYLKNMTITYPVLLDPSSSSRKQFAVAGIPTYYVLDRKSVIQHKILGEANKGGLDGIVKSLL